MFGETVKSDSTQIAINPKSKQLTLNLLSTLNLFLPLTNSPLAFQNILRVSSKSATGSGTLIGTHWETPFGMPGLSLENVTLKLYVEFLLLAVTGLPKSIALAGTLTIGSTAVNVATEINLIDPTQQLISGSVSRLPLKDLLHFAVQKVGGAFKRISNQDAETSELVDNFSIEDVPIDFMVLENVAIHACPEKTSIGSIIYEEGFQVSAAWQIFGRRTSGRFEITQQGVLAQGKISKFSLGPLLVYGPLTLGGEVDGDDALFDLCITDSELRFGLQGTVDLQGIKTTVLAQCSGLLPDRPTRIKWKYKRSLFDLIEYEIHAEAISTREVKEDVHPIIAFFTGPRDPLLSLDFRLFAKLEHAILQPFSDKIKEVVQTILKSSSQKIHSISLKTSLAVSSAEKVLSSVGDSSNPFLKIKGASSSRPSSIVEETLIVETEVISTTEVNQIKVESNESELSIEKEEVKIHENEIIIERGIDDIGQNSENDLKFDIRKIELEANLSDIISGNPFKAHIEGQWKGKPFVIDDISWDVPKEVTIENATPWIISFSTILISKLSKH
ncbi:hypothetical protein HK096_009261 [Nowakowskiella sp. JEL0078]|nr:hypothetical protein HK096_009261 [Nowakowskiella sp. JEL0078]